MALAMEPGDAYQLLTLFADNRLSTTLVERAGIESVRLDLPPEQTPAGRQFAALHRLTEQLQPLAFTDQARPLTSSGDASPPAASHTHPSGTSWRDCPTCAPALTNAAGASQ